MARINHLKRLRRKRAAEDARSATCIAPLDDVVHEGARALEARLCGQPATTTRVVEGLTCALCDAHAAEIDAETREQ